MINNDLLKKKIDVSGYKQQYIATRLGLSRFGLQKKVNNETEFKVSEIRVLCEVLKLSKNEREQIFFADEVNLIHQKAEVC